MPHQAITRRLLPAMRRLQPTIPRLRAMGLRRRTTLRPITAPRPITRLRMLTGGPTRATTRHVAMMQRRVYATLGHMEPKVGTDRLAITGAGKGTSDRGTRGPRLPSKGRGGRPPRAQALELREQILQVATELFLSEGYGSTSIEAVAARAGISKRTFYHRFQDKAELFANVVHRIIEQIRPPPGVPLLQGASLHEILRRLAGLLLRAALNPQAIALQRLVTAESARFPNLVRAVFDAGWARQATGLIADLLARELPEVRLTAEQRTFAAEQFLQMVVTVPQRRIIGLGAPMTEGELDQWADAAVALFLEGCRGFANAARG
jgi:TetR/AcrR family transcriptional repressor of mexJK operon